MIFRQCYLNAWINFIIPLKLFISIHFMSLAHRPPPLSPLLQLCPGAQCLSLGPSPTLALPAFFPGPYVEFTHAMLHHQEHLSGVYLSLLWRSHLVVWGSQGRTQALESGYPWWWLASTLENPNSWLSDRHWTYNEQESGTKANLQIGN